MLSTISALYVAIVDAYAKLLLTNRPCKHNLNGCKYTTNFLPINLLIDQTFFDIANDSDQKRNDLSHHEDKSEISTNEHSDDKPYDLTQTSESNFKDKTAISQSGWLQLLFDLQYIADVFAFCQEAPIDITTASAVKLRQKLEKTCLDQIDPFDMSVYAPFFRKLRATAYKRTASLLGHITQLKPLHEQVSLYTSTNMLEYASEVIPPLVEKYL